MRSRLLFSLAVTAVVACGASDDAGPISFGKDALDGGAPVEGGVVDDKTDASDEEEGAIIDYPPPTGLAVGTEGASGRVLLEYWDGVEGKAITDLTSVAAYPNRPSGRSLVSTVSGLRGHGNNYGTRIRGYVRAPEDGTYTFYISSDNQAEVWLSSDLTFGTRKKIAWIGEGEGVADGVWESAPHQVSAPVVLKKGAFYRIEVVHKQTFGEDRVDVGWKLPNGALERPVASGRLFPVSNVTALQKRADVFRSLSRSHPRIFASRADFERLKPKLTSDDRMKRWFAGVRKEADARLATNAPTDPGNVFDSREVMNRMILFSFMYQMTGDSKYSDKAFADLFTIALWPDWRTDHFLDTAEISVGVGIVYDWLYDQLRAKGQLEAVRRVLIDKGMRPGRDRLASGKYYQWKGVSNWNFVCNGGLSIAALAVGDDDAGYAPLASELLELTQASLSEAIGGFAPDGAWHEGPTYWQYGAKYLVQLIAASDSAIGGDWGFGNAPGISQIGDFGIHTLGPDGFSFNFGDSTITQNRMPWMQYVASKYRQPSYARLQIEAVEKVLKRDSLEDDDPTPSPLDLFWFNADGLIPDAGTPRDRLFVAANTVTMRSGFEPGARFVGFKGGETREGHQHLDAGEFVFDALGVRWAHDLGADDYRAPGYFDTEGGVRWKFYRTRAEGNNSIVLNPTANADQVPRASSPVVSTSFTAASASATANLTASYAPNATKVTRKVELTNGRNDLIVTDVVQAKTNSTAYYWVMNTKAAITLSADKKKATLVQDGKTLEATFDSGGVAAAFAELPATTLVPGIEPPEARSTAAFHRLVLLAPSISNLTMKVTLHPAP